MVVALAAMAALLVGCGSDDPPTDDPPIDDVGDALPVVDPATDATPDFIASEDCDLVEEVYHNRAIPLFDGPGPVEQVEATLGRRVDLLAAIAETGVADTVPDIDKAVAVAALIREGVVARWGQDGSAFIAEYERSLQSLATVVLDETVVVDGETMPRHQAESILAAVDDRLVLACAHRPEGWDDLVPVDAAVEAPDLTLLAGRDDEWSLIELATGRQGPSIADDLAEDLLAIELHPDGRRLLGTTWPERALVEVDPISWTTTPIESAGRGWSCASWSVDGEAIVGDLIGPDPDSDHPGSGSLDPGSLDPGSNERTPVILRLDDDAGPVPLPERVTSCPESIGPDELLVVEDDALVAVTLGGGERTVMALDGCNLVPITRPRNGVLDVYANCDNPYLDGLHLLDLEEGEATHHVAGRVGAGDVSPDGRWRVFVYGPIGSTDDELALWLLDQETGRAGPLDVPLHVYPIFVPSS